MFKLFLVNEYGEGICDFVTRVKPTVGEIVIVSDKYYYEIVKIARVAPDVVYREPKDESEMEKFVCKVIERDKRECELSFIDVKGY